MEKTNNINNFSKKKDTFLQIILNILVALPALFLLVNNYPYLMVLSILLIIAIGLLLFLNKPLIIKTYSIILFVLCVIFTYLLLSYFFSGQLVTKLFSYSFIRSDGNFFFCYIIFFILAIPFFNYKKAATIYFIFLFFIFSIFSLFGILEYIYGKTSVMIQTDVSAGKMFTALNFAHNATGSVYAVVSLFALVFFLNEPKKKLKFIYLFVLIICLAGLFLTKSRGSYIGFAIALIFVLWINYRSLKKFLISVSIFVIASIPIIFTTGAYKRILQIFKFSKDINTAYTTVVRLELWKKAWYLFLKSPIFGIGFGRFNDIEPSNYYRLKGFNGILSIYNDSNYIFSASTAHNSYLQFLAETGIVGLGLLILFWILCYRIIYRAYNSSNNIYNKRIYLSALAGIITLSILSFTENYMSSTTIMICISIATSLSIGLFWQERSKTNLRLNSLKIN